jgi:hypothetical protein
MTALLPAGVIGALAHDISFIALPLFAALFAGLWSAILSGRITYSSQFGYLRSLAVVMLSFICVAAVFAAMRPMPYRQAFVAFLIVGWGFMVFPGFVGGLVAAWLLKHFGHEPSSTVERDGPQAAPPRSER